MKTLTKKNPSNPSRLILGSNVGPIRNYRLLTSTIILSLSMHVLSINVFAYTLADDLIFNQRSPFSTQATLDSDFRLQGMGGLNLPVSDESNKVGTFKYGGAPAGLAQDYSASKVELGLSSEGGTLEDKQTNNTTFTGDVVDTVQATLHGMVAVKTGQIPENHGEFVVGLSGEGDKLEYKRSFLSANGYSKIENEPSIGQFRIGYGHQLGHFLFGLMVDSISSVPIDEKSTTISGTTNNIKGTQDVVDVTPSVGYMAPVERGAVTFTLSPRFHSNEEELKINNAANRVEQDGVLLNLGAHYGDTDVIQAALYLTLGGIDGDITQNGSAAGKADTDTKNIRFRIHARPHRGPVSFGILAERLEGTDKATNTAGTVTVNDASAGNTVGGGVAYHFKDDKGLVGVELRYINNSMTDKLNTSNSEYLNGLEVCLGGEHRVGSRLWLRTGLNVKSLNTESSGDPKLKVTTTQLAFGGEYIFTARASLALNISSVGIMSEGSKTAAVDKLEYSGGTFQLLGKYRFGE